MSLLFITLPSKKQTLKISYELFGQALHTAPIVLVNHALTGNSTVTGKVGWWNDLIGDNKIIDTQKYTVLAFNIPGNGYDQMDDNLIDSVELFTTNLVATYFLKALKALNINNLYAVIGGSLGGAIAWEMAFLEPNKIKNLIVIATNYKASDWLIGNVFIQESILKNSTHPIQDARKHAMFLYRCPEGINNKFKTKYVKESSQYQVENWLQYHGNELKDRFTIKAYKLMNHLLKTIGQKTNDENLLLWSQKFTGKLHIIAINSDLMFTALEQNNTYNLIKDTCNSQYSEIQSIHGHDAFLIEFNQLNKLLKPYF